MVHGMAWMAAAAASRFLLSSRLEAGTTTYYRAGRHCVSCEGGPARGSLPPFQSLGLSLGPSVGRAAALA